MYILSKSSKVKRYKYISNSIFPLSLWIKSKHSLFFNPLVLNFYEFGIRRIKEMLFKEK